MRGNKSRTRGFQREGSITDAKNLRTVPQVVKKCPAFSEAAIRKLILRAPLNGLEPAIVRIGRRVLIDYQRFNRWLEQQRGRPV